MKKGLATRLPDGNIIISDIPIWLNEAFLPPGCGLRALREGFVTVSSSTYLNIRPSSVSATIDKLLQPLQPVAVSPLIFGMNGGRSRDTRSRSSPVCHRREDEILFAEVVCLIRRLSLIYQTLHYRNDNFVLFFSLYAAEAPIYYKGCDKSTVCSLASSCLYFKLSMVSINELFTQCAKLNNYRVHHCVFVDDPGLKQVFESDEEISKS